MRPPETFDPGPPPSADSSFPGDSPDRRNPPQPAPAHHRDLAGGPAQGAGPGGGDHLPSVHRLLEQLAPLPVPRPLAAQIVRDVLAQLRAANAQSSQALPAAQAALSREAALRLAPVINATGIILHTNLGRAPLCDAAIRAVHEATLYTNLEYDVPEGRRGRRGIYAEHLLALLADAEAALIVNNCAAALVLILHHFCKPRRREVVISRGELVQIGGGFRVPEILQTARARLREVGTTNCTSLDDYANAITPATALLLRIHHSNFFVDGFTHAPTRRELASLARKQNLPFVEDLGSGNLSPSIPEPTPAQAHREGATLVCFSGDKLLGGPQAGIITGDRQTIDALRKNPLTRALRPDKLTLAALQATAETHLAEKSNPQIPILQMIQTPVEELTAYATTLAAQLKPLAPAATIDIVPSIAKIGGGSLPRTQIPSTAIALSAPHLSADQLAARLRQSRPAIIATISNNAVLLDLRTIFPHQYPALLQSITGALQQPANGGARDDEVPA